MGTFASIAGAPIPQQGIRDFAGTGNCRGENDQHFARACPAMAAAEALRQVIGVDLS
jgi:hypothetical protein